MNSLAISKAFKEEGSVLMRNIYVSFCKIYCKKKKKEILRLTI